MSRRAVEDLLAYWDESSNPILHAAAGQVRQAQSKPDPGTLHCALCGRSGKRGFLAVAGGDSVCENIEACERREVRL